MRGDRGLSSRRVVRPDGVVGQARCCSAGERIEAVVPERVAHAGRRSTSAICVVSPGLVDSHVHVNEPGRTDWEGFETATRAAAAGGVTTLVDMPLNSLAGDHHAAALDAKLAAAHGQLLRRRRLLGRRRARATPRDLDRAWPRAGVLGGKAFLVPSGIDEFPPRRRARAARGDAGAARSRPAAPRPRRARSRARRRAGRSARLRRLPRVAAARLGGRGDRAC